MTTAYTLLFTDSFTAMIWFFLGWETSWFAAVDFGTYNLATITAICFVASVLGLMCSALTGYICSMLKDRAFTLDEELYTKLSTNASKYGIYIFLFQMLPFVKIFYFFAGLFRIPFKRLLLVTLAGRALYYSYYLFIYPQIPSF